MVSEHEADAKSRSLEVSVVDLESTFSLNRKAAPNHDVNQQKKHGVEIEKASHGISLPTLDSPRLSLQHHQNKKGELDSNTFIHLIDVVESSLSQNRNLLIQRQSLNSAKGSLELSQAPFDWYLSSSLTRRHDITAYTETQIKNLTLSGITLDEQTDDRLLYSASLSRLSRWGFTTTLSADVTQTEETDFSVPKNDRGVWQLSIEIPLLKNYGHGSAAATERAAQNSLESERQSTLHNCSTISRDTILAYWNYRSAALLLSLTLQSEERSRLFMEETKELVNAKLHPESKLKQLQANLAQKKSQRIQAEFRVIEARHTLGTLMGQDFDKVEELGLPITPFPSLKASHLDALLEKRKRVLKESLTMRRDLQALQYSEQAADTLFLQAQQNLKPSVSLLGSTGFVNASEERKFVDVLFDDFQSPQWSLALSYSHGMENRSAKGLLKTRRSSLNTAKLSVLQLRQDILSQVSQSMTQLLASYARIQAGSESVENYMVSVEDEREKYKSGLSTQLQIIDTQDRLASAQAELIQAHADLARGITQLSYSSGHLIGNDEEKAQFSIENLYHLLGVTP
jgi:outer membrane protein TolC